MFSYKFIELEPFVTTAGNEIMNNITATNAFGDVSLLATMRALLFERLNGEKFHAGVTDLWPKKNVLKETLDELLGNDICNKIVFYNAATEADFNQAIAALSDAELKKDKDHNLTYLKELSQGIAERAPLKCHVYNNPDKNIALVVAQSLDIRTLRLLSTLMTRYCPNFFKDKPLTPEEKELLGTLTRRSSEDYKAALLKVSKKMNLRDKFLKVMIGNFERREMETMIVKTERRIRDFAMQIDNFMMQYSDAVRKHKTEMMTLEGMKLSLENQCENSELLTYLTARPNIELIKIDGDTIHVNIKTYCDIFDQTIWDKYAARGEIFRNNGAVRPCFEKPENARKLLNAIFCEDPLIRLKFCGYYNLSLRGSVYSQSNRNYGPDYADYLPNPHLQIHACLGDNRTQISRMLSDGNMIGALECTAASCKSLNMGEITQTIRPMIRDILSSTKKIIHTEDGDMTPEEALTWLNEKETKK